MKILHNNEQIYCAVYDKDWFSFETVIKKPLEVLTVDEFSQENKEVCLDIVKTLNGVDEHGDHKYIIKDGKIHVKEGWVQAFDEFLVDSYFNRDVTGG